MQEHKRHSARQGISKQRRVDPKLLWQKLPVETWFLVWRLYTGGIWDRERISAIVGTKIHSTQLDSIINAVDRLMNGATLLAEPVRCASCGAKLLSAPCSQCHRHVGHGGKFRDIPPVVSEVKI